MKSPPRFVSVLTALVLLALLVPSMAEFFVDQYWFASLGQGDVFSTIVTTQLALAGAAGTLAFGWLLVHLRLALRNAPPPPTAPGLRFDYQSLATLARLATTVIPILGAISVGLLAANHWESFLAFRHGVDFDIRDALLGHDVGFYIFTLPALTVLADILFTLLLASAVGTVAVYGLRGAIHTFTGQLHVARRARVHLLSLGTLMFIWVAFDAYLDTRHLVFSQTGPVAGASYADAHARLPALQLLMGVALLGAALTAFAAFRKRWVLPMTSLGLLLATKLLAVGAYPALLHRFSVLPNESEREAPFISRNIEATRAAYALDNVEERDLSPDSVLTRSDIENNRATVDNVRLWDHRPLLDTFAQIQEIRTYYEFQNVDNDRYMIDGELRQTMLSARELASASLPNRTWINEHFTFTHGYGVTLGPVNRTSAEGLPELFVQDIPPTSSQPELTVTQPAIYFGELTEDYVFVQTAAREFDYPSGDDNAYSEYTGADGIVIGSWIRRALLATYLGTFKVLLSNDLGDDSRVLLHRQILDRAERLAPFLTYDSDPYLVVGEDGRLTWILDAYTRSNRYPYAQPMADGTNYIRNSVKVTIDAYEGHAHFYVSDAADPIVRTWQRAFPSLFEPLSEMPEDLRAHLRYPEDLFQLQSAVFSVYHMDDAADVYNREDQWEVPLLSQASRGGTGTGRMQPYYTVMRLPGEDTEEFILMLPFTPKSKQNLAAWMVARSDGDHRGELVVYRFPKDRLVFGPEQIMNRINQDAEISRQVSLWDQRGSEALFGTLLVIPIEESLIYVAPLYLRSEGGRIPELKRVIAVYDNQIAMAPTLDAALNNIFAPSEAPAGDTTETEHGPPLGEGTVIPSGALPEQAAQTYEAAISAQRAGDWAAYGEHIDTLGRQLQALVRQSRGEEVATTSNDAPNNVEEGAPSDGAATTEGETPGSPVTETPPDETQPNNE